MPQDKKKLSVFPAFVRVKNRHVLVAGSGAEALAKIRLVAETSARIIAVAPDPEPQLYTHLKDMMQQGHALTWIDAPFDNAMLENAALVFAATGSLAQDGAVADAARQAHIPVNVVDHPDLCDFFTPALVNRAPVAVAIGTEGTGPVLAQLLRARIDALLAPRLGELARFAGRFREKVERYVAKGKMRRRFWHLFFSGAVTGAVFDNEKSAEKHLLKLLDAVREKAYPIRFLYVGNGETDWLTLAGQRALMEADTIVHDQDTAGGILDMARRDAVMLPVSAPPFFAMQLVKKLDGAGAQILRLVTDETRLAEELRLLGVYGARVDLVPSPAGGTQKLRNAAPSYSLRQAAAERCGTGKAA